MEYSVIKNETTYEETEKRSKFISYSFKVCSEAQVIEKLSSIRSLHHAAKHHVYAYVLENTEKYSDDGEPSGTSGSAVMSAIKSYNLKNVLIVVVRYFGGILLGTGGLRRMYKSGAMNVIKNSETVKKVLCTDASLSCNYSQMGQVMSAILSFEGKVLNTDYKDDVTVSFFVKRELFGSLESKLENVLRAKGKVKIICESYHEI